MEKYRYNIGLDDKYKFGIEIEFSEASLGRLYKKLKSEDLPVKLKLNHKSTRFDFDNFWCLDMDNTVTVTKNSINGRELLGGELSSRILDDSANSWMEIRNICNSLKNNGCKINGSCSCHINIDTFAFAEPVLFYEVFSKLVALYEDDMILFYMGDKYFKRDTQQGYSRRIKYSLLNKINKIDFENNDDYMKDLLYKDYPVFMLYDGINMQNIEYSNLLEIRHPNGTLNEKTIQNNINFSLKLIDAILNDKFDKDKLTFLVDKEYKDRWKFSNISDYNYDGFYRLVRTISTSSEDIDDIMGQYEKVLRTKEKVKVI